MVNKIETTNSGKKPIIDNDEALRLIDLIQQGDSNAENELAELGSVFIKAVAKQYVGKGLSDEELIAASRYLCCLCRMVDAPGYSARDP